VEWRLCSFVYNRKLRKVCFCWFRFWFLGLILNWKKKPWKPILTLSIISFGFLRYTLNWNYCIEGYFDYSRWWLKVCIWNNKCYLR
jgi:hypothetical protein